MNTNEKIYVKNGKDFGWGPDVAKLNPEKVGLLDNFVRGSTLDVGCGSGLYTKYLFDKGVKVVGVDMQLSFVNLLKKRFPKIRFMKGDLCKLPFDRDSFQTVILFDILEHVNDAEALKEAKRVARRMIISVPRENQNILLRYGLTHAHYLDKTHKRVYTKKKLRVLFNKLGLKIVYLEEALPVSISGLLINRLSGGNFWKELVLKIVLKPFLPEPKLFSTIFAVVEKRS